MIAEYIGVKVFLFWEGKLGKIIWLTHSRFRNSVLTTLCTAIPGKIQTTASTMIQEEPTQTISMTFRVNLVLNYNIIARIQEKNKVFNRCTNIVLEDTKRL
jgi:hypothetical protein